MKKTHFKITLFLSFMSFLACKTAQTQEITKPVEQYNTIVDDPEPSKVSIPVRIEAFEIERSVNNRINGVLYEDYNYNDGDNMMLKLMKSNYINVWFDGQNIYYRVPVSMWMKRNLTLTEAEATGEIALKFKTFFKVNPDWSLETYTNVEGYDWIQQPVLKMGFDLPVTGIANFVLEKYKGQLGGMIDQQVRQAFDFKTNMQSAWNSMQTPSLLSPEYKAWLKITPKSIAMTPIYTKNNVLSTTISVDAISEVLLGKQPAFRTNKVLPNYTTAYNFDQNDFLANVHTDIPYTEADSMVKLTLLGKEFVQMGKKIIVKDVSLYGQGEKLVIKTLLSGDFNGNIYMTGIPKYDSTNRQIYMENMEFDLSTKNILAKTANWLFHKGLVSMMEKNAKIPIGENLDAMKSIISESLKSYTITSGVTMKGTVESFDIQKIFLTPNSLQVSLNSKGKLDLMVKGLE